MVSYWLIQVTGMEKFKQCWVIIKRKHFNKKEVIANVKWGRGVHDVDMWDRPWNLPIEKFWWPLRYVFSRDKSMETKLVNIMRKGKQWGVFCLFMTFSGVGNSSLIWAIPILLYFIPLYWQWLGDDFKLSSRFHWVEDTWTPLHRRKKCLRDSLQFST